MDNSVVPIPMVRPTCLPPPDAVLPAVTKRSDPRDAVVGARLRSEVAEGLRAIAANPNEPSASRVRAFELIGKLNGVDAFREVADPNAGRERSAAEIDAEIEERLAKLAAGAWS